MPEWTPDICIYHGGCDDGFGAAWAVWKRWPNCTFVPGHYGALLPDVTNRRVLFVDFSAPRPVLEAMAATAASIVVIDHHKTAEADLEPYRVHLCGTAMFDRHDLTHLFRDCIELGKPPILAWLDMNQSGATMAWQFAHGGDRGDVPDLLDYIEDRDLWRFALTRTRRISAALRTYPMEFAIWDTLSRNVDTLADEGEIVLRAYRVSVAKLLRQAYEVEIAGHRVPVVNAPGADASDVCHALLDENPEAPFSASWYARADGRYQWSLRSEDDRLDVSEIASIYGGGGHRNAAGFQSDWLPTPGGGASKDG